MKAPFYLLTLPMGYNRGSPNIECVSEYISVEDLISSAIDSIVAYLSNHNPPYFDESHWHYSKTDQSIDALVEQASQQHYEELFISPDDFCPLPEINERVHNTVMLPYNAIRNHLIYQLIHVQHTLLVTDPYSHARYINWLSDTEFVVIVDPGELPLSHHPAYLNKYPFYV